MTPVRLKVKCGKYTDHLTFLFYTKTNCDEKAMKYICNVKPEFSQNLPLF